MTALYDPHEASKITRTGRFIIKGIYGALRLTDLPEDTAAFYQKRAALCYFWIQQYRRWGGDDKALISWQKLHAAESRKARVLMGIE